MAIVSFERIEKKFMMNEDQYQQFTERVRDKLAIDEYGLHTICNIYYDTAHSDLIARSIEKPVYKEKMRLRSYGIPDMETPVFLELKKKYKGVVYKRRIQLSLKEAEDYLNNGIHPDMDSQIMREIDYFIRFYRPVPKQFIAYDRIAMYGIENPEIRLTIDQNIRYRSDRLSLALGDDGIRAVPEGYYLMEIKVPGGIPLWMVRILDELKIYKMSFSKYGEVYRQVMGVGSRYPGLAQR